MSLPNFLRNENLHGGDHVLISIIPDFIKNIQSCCYCFNLKLGCKLIAVFDGLCGLAQTILSYQTFLPLEGEPIKPSQPALFSRDPISSFIFGIITVICALILLAGVILESKACLVYWICAITLSTTVFVLYNITELVFFDILSLVIQGYFIMIVLAFYFQLRKTEIADDEFEVLFTASNPQIVD